MKGFIRRHRILTFLAWAATLVLAVTAWFYFFALQRLPESSTAAPRDTALASVAHGPAIDASRALVATMRANALYPSMSVAVAVDGEVLWREAVGWADLGSRSAASVATQYPIGSTSKALTATAAMILADQAVLSLDAPIITYLPDLPEPYRKVTMRQLLSHRAGVRHYKAAFLPPSSMRTG